MLLLYMTSNRNMGILDKPCEETAIVLKQINGEFQLSKFVIQDMSNMNCYQYIAIDLACLKDSDDEIINTIVGIKSMYDIRIIILAPGYSNDTSILGRLFAEGIYNIITADKTKALHEEISRSLTTGMQYKDAIKYRLQAETNTKSPKVIIQKQNIKQMISVGICGALHRIGTTVQALNITKFLNENGYSACYIEDNGHGHMEMLNDFYDAKLNKNSSITYQGIDIFPEPDIPSILKGGYDFLVYDLGMFEETDTKQFLLKDIKIVCVGSKPWEAPCIMQVFKSIEGCDDIHFVFSFTSKDMENEIRKLMGKCSDRTYFSEYLPQLIDQAVNQKVYRGIFAEYMHEEKTEIKGFQSLVRRLVK